jgi:hypothetical protein
MRLKELADEVERRFDGVVPMVDDRVNHYQIIMTVLEVLEEEGFLALEINNLG